MAGVLTVASTVTCTHGAAVEISSSAKLTVGGSAVLLRDGVEGKTVDSCPANTPCKTVTAVTAGEASKLTAGGAPVLLDGLVAATNAAKVVVSADQTKLTAS
jgi:hypothetical protein